MHNKAHRIRLLPLPLPLLLLLLRSLANRTLVLLSGMQREPTHESQKERKKERKTARVVKIYFARKEKSRQLSKNRKKK